MKLTNLSHNAKLSQILKRILNKKIIMLFVCYYIKYRNNIYHLVYFINCPKFFLKSYNLLTSNAISTILETILISSCELYCSNSGEI